ncbi:arylsulfatase [Bacillus sp. SA1-12]|uniref:arylsulfatase n=1 Tax=Bacillus sp. SA1-12 TaxID=1455638 RepID=UPI0006274279|nr:arylsulfatase [Bacillus sp. SA1-12]KKI90485.1 arylsulfatase [Bacillus sp. SA1-12]
MDHSRFRGIISDTIETSTPYWEQMKKPKEGSPNVLLILLDDLGFSHLGCYGSDIHTPNIDRLAKNGLRYNNFHTTAICSPTRAALLTGRNPHSTGVSFVAHHDSGYPNGRSKVSKETAMLSEILQNEGFSTFAVGKWHLLPGKEQSNIGPFTNWPLGRGFDRYYGFLEGATSQWYPDLVEDNRRISQPKSPEEGYHLTEDLTDKAIQMIKEQKSAQADKPFFCYLAYGATHAPHHAPKEFIDQYKGKYDKGWDIVRQEWFNRQRDIGIIPSETNLPPRNPDIPEWDSLSNDQKKLFARMQEAFAGFLEHTDEQIGRLIDELNKINQLENTIIVFLSDNGACAMGGDEGSVNSWSESLTQVKELFENKINRIDEIGSHLADNHYPKGWASVGNTPFKWYKSFVHAGGIKDPLIIHYPDGINEKGGIRSQFHHVTDIVPTILELLKIDEPKEVNGVKQRPIYGESLVYSFHNQEAETRKKIQHYEMIGNRAIWKDGWKAVAIHQRDTSFEKDVWELYHVDTDYSESVNLANRHPEKLQELKKLWWEEARKYDVLPLDGRSISSKVKGIPNEVTKHGPVQNIYYPTENRFHSSIAPDIKNKSFEIKAELKRNRFQEEGVLVSSGSQAGGYVLYIKDNRAFFDYNYNGVIHYVVRSELELPNWMNQLIFRFVKTGKNQGIGQLYADASLIGQAEIKNTNNLGFSKGPFQIGQNSQSTISKEYLAPFVYQGALKQVSFTIGSYQKDLLATLEMELARE